MIQRAQSIYLFLAAITGLLTFFLPFAHYLEGDVKLAEYAVFGVFNVQSDLVEMTGPFLFPTWFISLFITMLPAVALFLYKKRPVQLRITRLGFLVNLSFIVYLFFAIDSVHTKLYGDEVDILYHAGFYMPVVALTFLFLSIRGIKKDEALIKSLDRIR
ncbi:MAG: hypothetical protein ACI9CP_000921 [Cryomorphaceae bacterium]|jgi:hypothetical protein